MADRETPPLPPEHDAFLAASAALARSTGAPEGVYAVVLCPGDRVRIPIVGSVNGRPGTLGAPKDDRLSVARRAMRDAERRMRVGR